MDSRWVGGREEEAEGGGVGLLTFLFGLDFLLDALAELGVCGLAF